MRFPTGLQSAATPGTRNHITSNYWNFRIYKQALDGTQAFVAEYVAKIADDAVQRDQEKDNGRLKSHFKTHSDSDPKALSGQQLEELLGSIMAGSLCRYSYGINLPNDPKGTLLASKPFPFLGSLALVEDGVFLWLVKTADERTFAKLRVPGW